MIGGYSKMNEVGWKSCPQPNNAQSKKAEVDSNATWIDITLRSPTNVFRLALICVKLSEDLSRDCETAVVLAN